MEQDKFSKVLSRLQAQCSRREFCTSDIRAKALKSMEGDAEAADRIVTSLKEDKFVDDLRYASAFAREKASLSGWGAQKITYALICKGIDRQVVRKHCPKWTRMLPGVSWNPWWRRNTVFWPKILSAS